MPSSLVTLNAHDHKRLSQYRGLMVACSGGLDSICLLAELHDLVQSCQLNMPLGVIHINFHLRSKQECDGCESFVADGADKLQLPFHPYHPWPLYAPNTGCGSEELWARQVAVQCYGMWQQRGYAIALAHHCDDQYETILFRLIRGSEPWNLAGLRRWNGARFRPLLNCHKADLLAYVRQHQLLWQEDSTNKNLKWARNQLRHTVTGKLESIQGGAKKAVLEYAAHSSELAGFIRHHFYQQLSDSSLLLKDLPLNKPAVCRLALEALAQRPLSMSYAQLCTTLKALSKNARQHKTFIFPQGTLHLHRGRLFFTATEQSGDVFDHTFDDEHNVREAEESEGEKEREKEREKEKYVRKKAIACFDQKQWFMLLPQTILTVDLASGCLFFDYPLLEKNDHTTISITVEPYKDSRYDITTYMNTDMNTAINHHIFDTKGKNILFISLQDEPIMISTPHITLPLTETHQPFSYRHQAFSLSASSVICTYSPFEAKL